MGFTHICGRSREQGHFTVYRKTIGKRMAAKLKDIRRILRQRMHASVADTAEWRRSVVRGYFPYHAVPDNEARLRAFRHDVQRLWLHQLRRCSLYSRWTWERFLERLGATLPPVAIPHPGPPARFAARHPR